MSDGLSWDSLKVLGLPRRMELPGALGGSLGFLGVEGKFPLDFTVILDPFWLHFEPNWSSILVHFGPLGAGDGGSL